MKHINDEFEKQETSVMEKPTDAPEKDKKAGLLAGKLSLFGHEFDKKVVVGAGIGLVCAVAIAGGCVWYAATAGSQPESAPEVSESAALEDDSSEEPQEEYVLHIGVTADGWDADTSSPVIAHVEGDGVDFYHAFDANDPDAVVEVPAAGDYTVIYISPINADGSIYRVPDALTVSATAKDDEVEAGGVTFTKVEASDATAEEVQGIVEQVAEAVKKGDETLTGDAGVEVVEAVEENAKANPNADAEKVEASAEQAVTSAETGQSQATGSAASNASTSGGTSSGGSSSASSSSGSSSSSGGTSSGGSSSSGSGDNGGSSSSGSSGSGGSSTSATSQPAHTHDWVAQTTTVHHDAVTHEETVYTTVHHDAIYEWRDICNGCGADITGTVDAHMKSALLDGNAACGAHHTTKIVTQQAYDEQVASGTETVVDQAAYDETVTTGYVCSGCGATK